MYTYDSAHRSDLASGSNAAPDDTRRSRSPLYCAGGLSAMAQADALPALPTGTLKTGTLQMRVAGDPAAVAPHAIAARGVSDAGGKLLHADRIQAAFGRHDISDAHAHVGGAARSADGERHLYEQGGDGISTREGAIHPTVLGSARERSSILLGGAWVLKPIGPKVIAGGDIVETYRPEGMTSVDDSTERRHR